MTIPELLAVCEAATAGPWERISTTVVDWRDGSFTMELMHNNDHGKMADLDFIVAASNHFPAALRCLAAIDVFAFTHQSELTRQIHELIERFEAGEFDAM